MSEVIEMPVGAAKEAMKDREVLGLSLLGGGLNQACDGASAFGHDPRRRQQEKILEAWGGKKFGKRLDKADPGWDFSAHRVALLTLCGNTSVKRATRFSKFLARYLTRSCRGDRSPGVEHIICRPGRARQKWRNSRLIAWS